MTFTLAIIGRPNVGKSTLFNKMAGKKLAIVDDTPGVTRDWREAEASFMGLEFRIIDTAGLEESFDDSMEGRMRRQTESALAQADMAMLMLDGRAGLTPMDRHFADWLRKQSIPVMVVVNKCESKKGDAGIYEAYELGLGEPVPISAEHGVGFSDLYALLRPHVEAAEEAAREAAETDTALDEEEEERLFTRYEEGAETGFGDEEPEPEDEVKSIKLAIVGRPNVGKSTLVNALLGEDRMMTGPEPGVTRDAIQIDWEFDGRKIRLVDTAGMRKKARVVERLEKMAVDESLRAIRLAHVTVLMLDANAALEKQDLQIAAHVIDEGRALVIALNKWDSVEDRVKVMDKFQYRLEKSLPQVKDVPVITISALKGRRLDDLIKLVLDTYDVWNARVPTGRLNRWLASMESAHPAPLTQGRPNRLRYITQIKARPPTFAVWVSRPKALPDSYRRYLVNGLRETFDIPGVPIRLMVRTSKNPYKN